jgi:hypothetical protein
MTVHLKNLRHGEFKWGFKPTWTRSLKHFSKRYSMSGAGFLVNPSLALGKSFFLFPTSLTSKHKGGGALTYYSRKI